jgi:hypothetical protein
VAIKVLHMADGFLGRWSQRKQATREGKAVEEPPAPQVATPMVSGTGTAPQVAQKMPSVDKVLTPGPDARPAQPPAPTLDDVKALRSDSSFAPFVARDVAPDVRNAAMKKLFTDPHYNVMDGLDIYIDDYSLPSPMPAAMLRQMASAKFLNLFDEDPASVLEPPAKLELLREDANTQAVGSMAQSAPATHLQSIQDKPNDHTDLRLQPDHAAGPQGSEREPERTPDPAYQPVPPGSR